MNSWRASSPRPIIEVDNLGVLDDKALDEVYQGLTQAMLREALGGDSAE